MTTGGIKEGRNFTFACQVHSLLSVMTLNDGSPQAKPVKWDLSPGIKVNLR